MESTEMVLNYKHENHLTDIFEEILAYRSLESKGHIRYVQRYTELITNQYARMYPRSHMTGQKIQMIVKAARLHDVGKIAMPDSILLRPGRLSRPEMELLKEHTKKGAEIVREVYGDGEYGQICYNVCLYHHEKYDGSGYPYGLKGEKIPIEAQIVGLADMYDTLIHASVNRKVCSMKQAYYMLLSGECGELSPKLKECFQEIKQLIEQVQ